jgi:hypothetical protein
VTRAALPLFLLLLAAPAAAAPDLLATGEALTRAGDASCGKPLERALFAAERDDAAYQRALAALGLCREVQGRYADAHGLVARALEAAPPETTPAGKAARWALLRAALRRLDERVARVLVTADPKAEVVLDGHSIGTADGKVLAVDPGVHVFEAREGGRTVAAAQITARAGDLPAVSLKASLAAPIPALETRQTAAEKGAEKPSLGAPISPLIPGPSPRGVAVGVAYGAGGVALVSGIVAGVLEAQRSAIASTLAPGACAGGGPPRCEGLRLAFEQRTGARNVALVAGGVALAAGGVAVVLHFTGVPVAKGGVGVMVGGQW